MFVLVDGVPTILITPRSSRENNPLSKGWIRPMRKPNADERIEKIIHLLYQLDIKNKTFYQKGIKEIKILVKNYFAEAHQLENLLNSLHQETLQTREFGKKYAYLCAQLANFEIGAIKVRDKILKLLQNDFEDKALQGERRANFYLFLGDIFHYVKISDGSPIKVLALPIIINLKKLLEDDDHNIYIFAFQMASIGKALKSIEPLYFDNLLLDLRRCLINASYNSISKIWLLIALEICDNNFAKLTKDKIQLYSKFIDQKILESLKPLDLEPDGPQQISSFTKMKNFMEKQNDNLTPSYLKDFPKKIHNYSRNEQQFVERRGRSIKGKGEFAKNSSIN